MSTDNPPDRIDAIVDLIKAKFASEVGAEFPTLWLVGDPSLPDNRAWNRIVAWVSGGQEKPQHVAQQHGDTVTAVRWIKLNLDLWARDQQSGERRVHALYNAIDAAIGSSDHDRGRVAEGWFPIHARSVSGWHVRMTFELPIFVYTSETYELQQAEVDESLPDRPVKVQVTQETVTIVADTEGFGPFVGPADPPP